VGAGWGFGIGLVIGCKEDSKGIFNRNLFDFGTNFYLKGY